MLVYFMKGKLPWQIVKDKDETKVYKMKQEISLKDLTKGLPKEFLQYLHYSRAIKFEDKPGYEHLKSLFTSLSDKKNLKQDFIYDWNNIVTDLRTLMRTCIIFHDNENNGKKNEEEAKTSLARRRSSMQSISPIKNITRDTPVDKLFIIALNLNKDPCNFELKDTLENSCLLGIYKKTRR